MAYSPRELGITLSYECNLRCAHCIVKAGPEKKGTISLNTATKVLDEARENDIDQVLLYGGEPFLQRDLMLEIADQALSKNFNVCIDSNGFWGEDESAAKHELEDLQELASKHGGYIHVWFAVDKYHQPQVPIGAIANIIAIHRVGDFPNVRLGIGLLKDEQSSGLLSEMTEDLFRRDIYLAKSRYHNFMYPALSEELKPYRDKQHERLIERLGLENDASDQLIEQSLSARILEQSDIDIETTIPLMFYISRKRFFFDGKQSYIIVPDNYLIEVHQNNLVKAGRSQEGLPIDFPLRSKHAFRALFIDPNGRAFAHPALTNLQEGIPVDNKPLSQVIFEVGESLKK